MFFREQQIEVESREMMAAALAVPSQVSPTPVAPPSAPGLPKEVKLADVVTGGYRMDSDSAQPSADGSVGGFPPAGAHPSVVPSLSAVVGTFTRAHGTNTDTGATPSLFVDITKFVSRGSANTSQPGSAERAPSPSPTIPHLRFTTVVDRVPGVQSTPSEVVPCPF